MNLIDLLNRGDPMLQLPQGARHDQFVWGGSPWRSLVWPANAEQILRANAFATTHPAWSQPEHLGWYARSRSGRIKLEITIQQGGKTVSRGILACGDAPVPVPIPWPTLGPALGPEATLSLRATAQPKAQSKLAGLSQRGQQGASGKPPEIHPEIEILVHRQLDRQVLYDLAKGTGIEVGPGPNPQIQPGPDVDVSYIEEMPRERWIELYDSNGKFGAAERDWSRIQTGKASALPVADSSQDFIFSSHVFEHLANPLGHLEHWHAKLKPGGHVLMVVPELSATKDRFMRPSALKEIAREYAAQIWEPQLHHYQRNVMRLNGQKKDPIRAQNLMNRQESIHVHFYDRCNMAQVMQAAQAQFGYTSFRLIWAQNHKDFYIVITK